MAGSVGSIGRDVRAFTSLQQRPRAEINSDPGGGRSFGTIQRQASSVGIAPAESSPQIRAGFGANTLSPAGAALFTLDSTVRYVRQNTPTLEEQRDELRNRLAELEEITGRRADVEAPEAIGAREQESLAPQQVSEADSETTQANAANPAREFVESLNEGAGQSFARFRADELSSAEGASSPRPGAQIFPVEESARPTVLNVQV